MKNLLLLFLLISIAACNNAANTDEVANTDSPQVNKDSGLNYIHTFSDTLLENKITAVLMKLPFVIKSDKYIDSFSNHKHGMVFMMDNPTAGETDVHVQAGYNGVGRFETYYRFFVNPKTLEIKVYDPIEDKKLSVNEYLKTQQ